MNTAFSFAVGLGPLVCPAQVITVSGVVPPSGLPTAAAWKKHKDQCTGLFVALVATRLPVLGLKDSDQA